MFLSITYIHLSLELTVIGATFTTFTSKINLSVLVTNITRLIFFGGDKRAGLLTTVVLKIAVVKGFIAQAFE